MDLFSIDESLCNKDGICAMACPMALIIAPDGENPPRPVDYAKEACIRCGHCVTACPKDAFVHEAMGPGQCPAVEKNLALSPEQAEQFLRSRRSIRNYKKELVDKEVLTRLIHISRYAPTGHNSQPLSWIVVEDPEKVREMGGHVADWMRHLLKTQEDFAKGLHMDMVVGGWDMGHDAILRGAPHIIATTAPKDSRSGPASSYIALAYLELMAPSLGLGTCWGGYFTYAAQAWQPLREALGVSPEDICLGAVMVGRPKLKYRRMPERNEPPIRWVG